MGPEAIEHRETLMRECSSTILIHLLPLELVTEVSCIPDGRLSLLGPRVDLRLKVVRRNVRLSQNRCHNSLASVLHWAHKHPECSTASPSPSVQSEGPHILSQPDRRGQALRLERHKMSTPPHPLTRSEEGLRRLSDIAV